MWQYQSIHINMIMEDFPDSNERIAALMLLADVHYRAEEYGDGKDFGVNLHFSKEEKILGTAGGIKKLQSFFKNETKTVNGEFILNHSWKNIFNSTAEFIFWDTRKDIWLYNLDTGEHYLSHTLRINNGVTQKIYDTSIII